MNTPEQTDRDDIFDWGHDPEEVREYYENERLWKEANRQLKVGNVVFNKSMERKFVVRVERTLSINEEFVCESPHDDGDFSYMCGSNYCKCCE